MTTSPGLALHTETETPFGHQAHASGGDEKLVRRAAIHDFGVACYDRNAGFGSGFGHRLCYARELFERQSFFHDERGGKK